MAKEQHCERDLGVAAYLMTAGYKLAGLQKINEGFRVFIFEDPAGTALQDAQAFHGGAAASADRLLFNLRKLKALLRQEKHPEEQNKEPIKNESRYCKSHPAR